MTIENPSAPAENPRANLLWCVEYLGMGDVCPAPDFDTAEQWAIKQNQMMREYEQGRGLANDPHWPFVRAVVASWPWSAEAQAEGLAHSIEQHTVPLSARATGGER